MNKKLLAATALAGSLAMTSFMWGSAQATPSVSSSRAPTNSLVTLVAHMGGGGGPGGGGGGPAMHGGGPGGAQIHGGAMTRGPRIGGPRIAEGDRGRIERGDQFADRHDRGDRFDHRHFAEREHDFDRFHNRHRVFRNGVWVWAYGPDYYAYGDDCWWLQQRAYTTGSPYWWSRYNYCVGYY